MSDQTQSTGSGPAATAVVVRSLDEIEAEVGRLIAVGCRASQQIAVLVHAAKADHFVSVPEWLSWCGDKFGYARRTAFSLAKVGGMLQGIGLVTVQHAALASGEGAEEGVQHAALSQVHHDALLDCDTTKLEALAELYEQKPDQFDGLLRQWDPSAHSREQVRAKVKIYLGEVVNTCTCKDCKREWESAVAGAERCPDCEKRRKEEKERREADKPARDVDRAIQRLAEIYHANDVLASLVDEIAPGMAFTAALTCLDLVGAHVSKLGDVDRERMMGFVEDLEKALGMFRGLAAEAGE